MTYYFIPAWYSSDRRWSQPKMSANFAYTFDDTVNQVRMFREYGEPSQLIILNYQPYLRLNLHAQGLYGSSYLSLFDYFQAAEDSYAQSLDWRHLTWPPAAEFIYHLYGVRVQVQGDLYAQVHFHQLGYVAQIDRFEHGELIKSLIVDDRGWISSFIAYEAGQAIYQDYLTPEGERVFRQDLSGQGEVSINPKYADRFLKSLYDSIDDLLKEGLSQLEKNIISPADPIIFAAHPVHNALLLSSLGGRELVPTFFQGRRFLNQWENLDNQIGEVKLVVVDSDLNEKILQQQLADQGASTQIYQIAPYNTHLSLGKSQQVKEQYIFINASELNERDLTAILKVGLDLYKKDSYLRFQIVSRGSSLLGEEKLKNIVKDFQDDLGQEETEDVQDFEDKLPEKNDGPIFSYLAFNDDISFIQGLEKVRLVVDLSSKPDLFLQIAAVSVGIPQINAVESTYVHHLKNGYIAENDQQLKEGLIYYLDGLKHWNEALVFSVNLINEHYNAKVVERWKKLLEGEADE